MNPMLSFGRVLLVLGGALMLIGGLLYFLGKSGISFARIPGNIRIQSGNATCVFALGASIALSILLTLALNLIARFLNR